MGPNSIISRYCPQGGNLYVFPGAGSHRSKWLSAQAELSLCHCHGSESSTSYSHGNVHCYFSPSVLGLLLLLTCRYCNTGICFPEMYGTDCKCCIIPKPVCHENPSIFFFIFKRGVHLQLYSCTIWTIMTSLYSPPCYSEMLFGQRSETSRVQDP